jgi:hypothetical protein
MDGWIFQSNAAEQNPALQGSGTFGQLRFHNSELVFQLQARLIGGAGDSLRMFREFISFNGK